MAFSRAMVSRSAYYRPANILVFEEKLDDLITDELSTAVFECKVIGHPRPKCIWHKNGVPIIKSHRITIISRSKLNRLEIKKVTPADDGIYSIVCCSNCKQLTSKAFLMVAWGNINKGIFHVKPEDMNLRVVTHLRNIQVKNGQKICMKAIFQPDGLSQRNYFWFKNNEFICDGERAIIMNTVNTSTLTFNESEITDTAIYHVVAKNEHGIASSFSKVLVTKENECSTIEDRLPIINEEFANEIEVTEKERVRLILKATYDKNTTIDWYHNGSPIEQNNFEAKDYGNNYLALNGKNITMSDAGEYSVVLSDVVTKRSESCSIKVIVQPAMSEEVSIDLKRPLEAAVACYGSKITFDCSFLIKDPKYFYVVWYVGRFKVERSNSRFEVICEGSKYLLHIKKIEPGMSGEVVCELRRAHQNRKSVRVNQSCSTLNIVPSCFIEKAKIDIYPIMPPKIHDSRYPCVDSIRSSVEMDDGVKIDLGPSAKKVLLEIEYSRMDEKGLFYLHGSTNYGDVIKNLRAKQNPSNKSNTVFISWDDASVPKNWYSIDILQNDGSYVKVATSSLPSFELQDAKLDSINTIRVRTAKVWGHWNKVTVSIKAYTETPPVIERAYKARKIEEYNEEYSESAIQIGRGAFGKVLCVKNYKGELFAAKVIKTRNESQREQAKREHRIISHLRHPKIVTLIECFRSNEVYILVQDFLWGGELFDRIVDDELIEEVDVVQYVKQILDALDYLHAFNIVHMDIKPENIICLSPNSKHVKLIDFGLAKVLEPRHNIKAHYGTRDYAAPEVLNFDKLNLASDMWSLGVVTYVLLSGVMPFAGRSWNERSSNITQARYDFKDEAFDNVSSLARDFVENLLVRNPNKRMTTTTALNHRWIREGPPKHTYTGHLRQTRENLRSYLVQTKWQRAGNVMIAAHCLQMGAEITAPCDT